MQESWVQLQCPNCGEDWEESVADLPKPAKQFQCDSCDHYATLSEFLQTARDLEIVREFHE